MRFHNGPDGHVVEKLVRALISKLNQITTEWWYQELKAYNGKEATLTNKMEADWMLDH